MKPLSKNILFIAQFILIGLGIAFTWLLITGGFEEAPVSGPKPIIENASVSSSNDINTTSQPSNTEQISANNIIHTNHLGFAEAVEIAKPAVVNVHTATVVNENQFRRRLYRGLGSGVIVDASGYILTNHHVIKDADSIAIEHSDGRSSPAELIGTDPDTDLALLYSAELNQMEGIASLDFANSDNLHVGDIVLAIGNQYGIGQTVTQGIVSAKGRANLALSTFEDFIQTDANISSGNSGGALVNTNGELVGINTAQLSRQGVNSGIGLAIPANLANGVFAELKEHGRVIRGWLGLETGIPRLSLLQRLNIEADFKGIMIERVVPGSPASLADLQIYDIIETINEVPISNQNQVLNMIASLKPDTSVDLQIRRGEQRNLVTVVIAERPVATD